MKIYFPNDSRTPIGGGWTFLTNITKYISTIDDVQVVKTDREADIIFICGATMIKGEKLKQWKEQGKKIVLRVDGIPKDSRNRGCGVSRLRNCADNADLVIFQSEWSKDEVGYTIEAKGPVIYNGCDQSIFYPSTAAKPKFNLTYLYVGYRKDENKRVPEAMYHFARLSRSDPERRLSMVGRFNDDLVKYNFDLCNNEKVKFLGVMQEREELADVMRSHQVLLFPSFADACPNTVVEAISCGMEVQFVNEIGGTRELLVFEKGFFSLDRMGGDYIEELKKL